MRILTQNLKTGKTNILNVPSPSYNSNKIRITNKYSLISTGTESTIVNFGKIGWIDKARQQPDKIKEVLNKIKSSGLIVTYRAVMNKLDFPMVMGYSAVGVVSQANENHNFNIGDRIFTNSCHQEEALVDYNMCVEIPSNLDSKSASFGAIGGIAIQSINCIPEGSKCVAIIGLGLLGQITLRILIAKGYKCIVFDLDSRKMEFAERYGAIRVLGNLTESILNHTSGKGADATIIAAASPLNNIVNEAALYTKRKGIIISSGVIGLNLQRDNFFKKQVKLVVSNSSGDKFHRGEGSAYENIKYFFNLLSSNKVEVLDLIYDEITLEDSNKIYSFPKNSLFFSRLIKYEKFNGNLIQTFIKKRGLRSQSKIKVGLIGTGSFAMSTLIPSINKSKDGYLASLFGREGLSLFVAQNKFDIDLITTDETAFYNSIDVVCVTSTHQTHFQFLKKSIELSLPIWIEKPLVISNAQLVSARNLMLANETIYAVGYNRSLAPWTNYAKRKISSRRANIEMIINAGILPQTHWLLDEASCGGRIIGEFCHFIDLSLTLLNHTQLTTVECIKRDRYYQDTGDFILKFKDGSVVFIQYRHDLPPEIPKEKIIVKTSSATYMNYNWNKFSGINFIQKGKGHDQAIFVFLSRVKNHIYSTKTEINHIIFSTYIAIRLQKMEEGDSVNVQDEYTREILDMIIE